MSLNCQLGDPESGSVVIPNRCGVKEKFTYLTIEDATGEEKYIYIPYPQYSLGLDKSFEESCRLSKKSQRIENKIHESEALPMSKICDKSPQK